MRSLATSAYPLVLPLLQPSTPPPHLSAAAGVLCDADFVHDTHAMLSSNDISSPFLFSAMSCLLKMPILLAFLQGASLSSSSSPRVLPSSSPSPEQVAAALSSAARAIGHQLQVTCLFPPLRKFAFLFYSAFCVDVTCGVHAAVCCSNFELHPLLHSGGRQQSVLPGHLRCH
jgi:hypothetical protein